jgi:hypothetical protein
MGSDEKDFVFRFKVGEDGAGEAVYDDPLTELVRSQLEALLEVVVLTRGGEELRGVDGFRFMKHLDRQYGIYPDTNKD